MIMTSSEFTAIRPVRLVCKRIKAEQGLSLALMAQRHIPRGLIEISLEAAVPDLRLFGADEDACLLRPLSVLLLQLFRPLSVPP